VLDGKPRTIRTILGKKQLMIETWVLRENIGPKSCESAAWVY